MIPPNITQFVTHEPNFEDMPRRDSCHHLFSFAFFLLSFSTVSAGSVLFLARNSHAFSILLSTQIQLRSTQTYRKDSCNCSRFHNAFQSGCSLTDLNHVHGTRRGRPKLAGAAYVSDWWGRPTSATVCMPKSLSSACKSLKRAPAKLSGCSSVAK